MTQKPKTVQIAVTTFNDGVVYDEVIYALQDDGSIWRIERNSQYSRDNGDVTWEQIAPIPEPNK